MDKNKLSKDGEKQVKTETVDSIQDSSKNNTNTKTVQTDDPSINAETKVGDNVQSISEASMTAMMYYQLNKLFGGGSQLFTMEYPGRSINQLDYAYKIENYNDSAIGKPYIVAENEFKLSDDMMDLAPIVQGPNGKKVSTIYDTAINNLTPKIDDVKDYIIDKMELRIFLMEPITDVIGDKEYTCSRMEFCQKLYLYYIENKAEWDKEKYENNKQYTKDNKLEDYAQWLATTAWTKDKELEQLFNDAIVRGFYHEIMTILGFLDISSPAERLADAKMNKRASIRRTVDASGTALPVTFQPTDWFRSLTPNFAPQDLTMDMDALKADYKSKINLLNSLKAELRVLVTKNVSNETIADLQKNISELKKDMLEDEKTYYKGLTDTQRNMVKLAFEIASKGDIVGFISQDKTAAIDKLKNLKSNNFAELFGLSETALQSMLENTYDLYQKHLDYFEKYQDLLQAQLSYVASQTSDYSDRISILTERISLLEREISELAVIVTSGSYEDKSWTEESGDILPASRYDEDSMCFDVVFSNKTFDDITEQEKKSSIAKLSGSIGNLFFNSSSKLDYNASNSKLVQKMMQSDFTIGMRVTKVNIERGGWFDPGIFDISSSYMRLKKHTLSGAGLTPEKILEAYNKDGEKLYEAGSVSEIQSFINTENGNYIFPSYPTSFLVAKDIVIRANITGLQKEDVQEFKNITANSTTSLFGIKVSGGSSTQSYMGSNIAQNGASDFCLRIPGPQIMGWFMELTPMDNSYEYESLSKSEYFNEIIDSLKEYRRKLGELAVKDKQEDNPYIG